MCHMWCVRLILWLPMSRYDIVGVVWHGTLWISVEITSLQPRMFFYFHKRRVRCVTPRRQVRSTTCCRGKKCFMSHSITGLRCAGAASTGKRVFCGYFDDAHTPSSAGDLVGCDSEGYLPERGAVRTMSSSNAEQLRGGADAAKCREKALMFLLHK